MRVMVSLLQVVCADPSSLHSPPAPVWGPCYREVLQGKSFPWVVVLHKLFQRVSLAQGAVLQEQTASAQVPHGVTNPDGKPAPEGLPLSMGHRCCQEPAPVWVSHGVIHRLQVGLCSTRDLHSCRGLTLGCRGISAPALVSAGLFLRRVLSPLSGCCCEAVFPTSSLCCPRGAVAATDGLSLGQGGGSLETAGTGSLYMGKVPGNSSQKSPL